MPTYVYFGHESDLVKKISRPDEPEKWNVSSIETVPEGCTYATISETGANVAVGLFFYIIKIATDPTTKHLLMEPKANFTRIKELVTGRDHVILNTYLPKFGPSNTTTIYKFRYGFMDVNDPIYAILYAIYNSTYHLKLPQYNYINRECSFLLNFANNDQTIRIHRSGLYDIEQTIDPPLPTDFGRGSITTTKPYINKKGHTYQVLALGDVKKIYKGSLFPTIDNILSKIKEIFDDIDINNDNYILPFTTLEIAVNKVVNYKTQRDLLVMFPGNHFNFSCRGYGYKEQKLTSERIQQLRQQSIRQIYNESTSNRLNRFNSFSIPAYRKGRKNRSRKNSIK